MNLAGYEFEQVCDIEPRRDADGSIAIVAPQARYKGAATVAINRYGSGPFCKFTIPARYTLRRVYLLLIVGECANLSARFNAGYGNISPRNCFKGGQETNCRVNNLVLRRRRERRACRPMVSRHGFVQGDRSYNAGGIEAGLEPRLADPAARSEMDGVVVVNH